jgi:putative selenate reductase
VVVDPATGMSVADVYAGGDVVRGPAIIIQACADGRRAAEAICHKLGLPFQSPGAHAPGLSSEDILQVKGVRARKLPMFQPAMLPVPQRSGFAVVEQGYDEATARAEAARCLQCSTFCDKCVEVCPNRANYTYLIEAVDWRVAQLSCQNGCLGLDSEEPFSVTQPRQIIHLDDFCNECGNCATFCVHPGKPYTEKPRLFLQRSDFEQEDDNAYHIEGTTIWRREGGRRSTLSANAGAITFENAQVRVSLSPDFAIVGMELKEPFEGTLSLREAAEMALILRGVTGSLPFLTT